MQKIIWKEFQKSPRRKEAGAILTLPAYTVWEEEIAVSNGVVISWDKTEFIFCGISFHIKVDWCYIVDLVNEQFDKHGDLKSKVPDDLILAKEPATGEFLSFL